MNHIRPRVRLRRPCRGERGQVSAFLVAGITGILLLTGLVLDGGLALSAKVEAIGHAQEAARAGAQQLDLAAFRADGTLTLDPHAAGATAHEYLDAAGATGTVTVAGDTITVNVTATYSPQLLSLAGISTVDVAGTASAQPHRGDTADGDP
ncbi:TadE/TadG family type IV pilus assembly protein [Phytoactinopolyspora endophytica]|uniref:TadE/TadG family type IV pilus assembly protein n=1 Tax=Phytoactinopolyspora endophytica TaxID=1642495 RepID=UPI00101C47D1|nr:pilus assembly protein TadG-related protein [Phytoactinopolyspora endophytica]